MIAKILIDLSLDRTFDYIVPSHLEDKISLGTHVRVPFGNSTRLGFVVDFSEQSTHQKLKEILSFSPSNVKISENLLKLGLWMADYYCCSQEQAIRTLLPGAVRNGKITHKLQKVYSLKDNNTSTEFINTNSEKKSYLKRIDVLKFLSEYPNSTENEICEECHVSSSTIKTLLKNELIKSEEVIVRGDLFCGRKMVKSSELTPTPEQKKALDIIGEMLNNPEKRKPILLKGVTNSGKTEVYLQSIGMALKLGLQAIVLVPEISLTPQTIRRFRGRFGDAISVLHSHLSERERFDEWMRINNDEAKIVVGARSALFAPLKNLGLIIVDEEHDGSYKQSEAPRYNARDVAVVRGKYDNAIVILGSATPSAESYYNALNDKYKLINMKAQVDSKLSPIIKVIDQRLAAREEGKGASFFSDYLVHSVNDRLLRKEQSILFLNRRGYARVMTCNLCGFEAKCKNCSINYTYSKQNETLSCHLCGDVIEAPTLCPNCQSPEIRYSGIGTEKIEIAAQAVFKNAKIGRMDSDTMRNKSAYEKILNQFQRGEIDILIGTQMLAKGLHFPNVTLVGIINADQGLNMPDFRAPERTFQLITQVAGRAGRGEVRGEVIIQSYNPENETIKYASELDFQSFYEFDSEIREMLQYPPFGHLMVVHFRSENEELCVNYATKFRDALTSYLHKELKISGPSPSPIPKIKNYFRYMIIIRGKRLKNIRQIIRNMVLKSNLPEKLDIYVDIDAQSML